MLYRKSISTFYLLTLTLILSAFSVNAGTSNIDETFNASAYGAENGSIFETEIQPDGKFLVGGLFTAANGLATTGVARFNGDGSVDTSFSAPDFYDQFNGIGGIIYAIAVQTDGKILVAGKFLGIAGDTIIGVRRLNSNGSIDNTFFVQEILTVIGSAEINDIEFQSDGKILVGGSFGFINPVERRNLIRLNADGTLDQTFTGTTPNGTIIRDILVSSDDKMIIAGRTGTGSGTQYIRRFNADGSIDSSFLGTASGSGSIETVKQLSSGEFIIGGTFGTFDGFSANRISKLTTSGTIDLTFNQNSAGFNGGVFDIELLADGRIVVGGDYTSYNGQSRIDFAVIDQNGILDNTIVNNTSFTITFISDLSIFSNGKIIAGSGILNRFNQPLHLLNSDGSEDTNFIGQITKKGSVNVILPQPDGSMYVGGQFKFYNGVEKKSLVRISSDGTLDNTFNANLLNFNDVPIIVALAVQANGKILVGEDRSIYRLNQDGSRDSTFSVSSVTNIIKDIELTSDGKILIAGTFPFSSNTRYIIRVNENGALDNTFAVNQPNGDVRDIFIQPNGDVLIGGEFTQIGSTNRGRIAKLDGTNGNLDSSFNPLGGANGNITAIDVQSDGKIIIGGKFTSLNGNPNTQNVGRLNADGSIDNSFAQVTNGEVFTVNVQDDGKIFIGGSMSAVSGIPKNGIAKLQTNGSIDPTFNAIANTFVKTIVNQSDGKVLAGGEFTKISQQSAVRIVRFNSPNVVPASTLYDFDGDGSADISVFRPGNNVWYQLLGANYQFSQTSFGITGDIVAPGDFDGDGLTDISIYRPSNGNWWYLSSVTNTQVNIQFGQSGDIPRPSDFDGDGKTDFVLYRPSNNVWYRLGSTGATSIEQFGIADDKPVVGDFDGDGKGDLAIYRPATGTWWYQSSIDGQNKATQFGISTDIPTPADFDGDGTTDLAVYRASTGVWYIFKSSTQASTIVQFGISEDKPIAADYDGDGKADIAVYRPSTGVWYLLKSTAGFVAIQFGVSTDIPVQNSLIP